MKYAPVIIPTLCRYEKFVQCMESLRKNSWAKYTEIYVAVDYPSKESHWEGYNRICEYLNQDFPEFKATARYNRQSKVYIVGPFKVNYIRDFIYTLRGKAEFGLMVDMNIYDQKGRQIPRNYWLR